MTDRHLNQLQRNIELQPHELSLKDVLPIFVPASFFEHTWIGPYELYRAPGVGLTWAIEQPEHTMRYVDQGVKQYWEKQKIDWRSQALSNLRERSTPQPWTHELRRSSGGVYAVVMMHEDGFGPSRLLLQDALVAVFPEGYQVALPEMSMGLAMSVQLDQEERLKVEGLVDTCYSQGTRPLAPGIFSSTELAPSSRS
jgi:hypothetical protein